MRSKVLKIVFVMLVALLPAATQAVAADTVVIVVRHAEKATDDPKDPSLSERGSRRAQALAGLLADARLTAVYATQYRRSRQTGAPAATQHGLQVQVREATATNSKNYAADLLAEINARHAGETVLVVGHSNTVGELVQAFTGKQVKPIAEVEYDRVYFMTLGAKPRLFAASYDAQPAGN